MVTCIANSSQSVVFQRGALEQPSKLSVFTLMGSGVGSDLAGWVCPVCDTATVIRSFEQCGVGRPPLSLQAAQLGPST